MDSNHRPSGYEPDELPLLHAAMMGARTYSPSGHPASTFGAAAFHDPGRDGTGGDHGASRTPLVQGPVERQVVGLFCASLSLQHTSSPREALVHAPASPARVT